MWSCFRLPKDRVEEEEERHFLKNGGLLLEEMIKSFDGRPNPIRSFSQKELQRATNNYHQDGFLHQHWSYQMYKGTYEDRPIWVKKFPANALWGYITELYINEVAVASQMSKHKNVLKLLGCCLETQVPTLVYEFAANGRLSDHIYEDELSPSYLSWESRLRIATEIADAVAYLHNGTSKPIIHRAIKPQNIFLDQHNVAKLSEFGLSISIPLGETHVDVEVGQTPVDVEVVSGTYSFIALESALTLRYSEKSDVYSFGVVLFEILTGEMATNIVWDVPDGMETILRFFIEDNENEYLKTKIVRGNTEQLMACAELALRCVKRNWEERPSMIEAAKELRRITRFQR
ncbi:hypothetical protein HHK36_022301 [Tetracentron sinense]|uniref:Protein kinase domain-containing protein n=1 Tax=Tetracentron sinense TaxID=13715 RepID=A0A834YRP0_TETSI|nr:hypothetical protein HHK36_022301 [Tetracentron sinense]